MASEKKIEFLIKQGFDKDVINVFIECGVDKNLVWFLSMYKNGSIEHLNGEDIKLINLYFEKTSSNKKKIQYSDALIAARKFEKNEKRKEKNKIYHFENGFYISILNSIDLREEGSIMSNCIDGYEERVNSGVVGLLALKQSNGKTVAHIEINKNGLIGQNYSKANSQISREYWMMILEFFEKNSKSVDLSEMFGESHVVTAVGGSINEVILTIPTRVHMFVEKGSKKTEQVHGFEVKRFTPSQRNHEAAIKISSKSEVIEWIEQKKQDIIKTYDELAMQVISTSASKLFLSDSIKEKIFGTKNGAYTLKGDKYNLLEIDPRFGQYDKEVPDEGYYENEPMEPVVMPMIDGLLEEAPENGFEEKQPEAEDEIEVMEREMNDEVMGEAPERLRPAVFLVGRRRPMINVANEDLPQIAVQEIAYGVENEEIAEGNVYEIAHVREAIERGDDLELDEMELPGEEGYVNPPEPFNEIIRRAVRR